MDLVKTQISPIMVYESISRSILILFRDNRSLRFSVRQLRLPHFFIINFFGGRFYGKIRKKNCNFMENYKVV